MNRNISRMRAPELVELLGRVPILIPVGSLEQHGAHLPLDTDTAIARAFALEIADRLECLVAPDLSYGHRSQPASGGGEIFRGTTSISGSSMCDDLFDVLLAFARHGQRIFAFINGHFENSAFVIEAAQRAVHRMEDLKIVVINWWEMAETERLNAIFAGEFPGWAAEHAGIVETSLMMHLHPQVVREDLIESRMAKVQPPTYTVLPERRGLVDHSGVLRTAWGSSPEIGRDIFDHVVLRCTKLLKCELIEPEASKDIEH